MRLVLIYLFINIGILSYSQTNLVPNWSFEVFENFVDTICDRGIDRFSKDWFTPINKMPPSSAFYGFLGESDLYSTAFNNPFLGVPKNNCGIQSPYIDSCYAGIILTGPLHTGIGVVNLKEYLEVKLNQSLSTGRDYCVEFYYSIGETSAWYSMPYKPSQLGVLLSDSLVYFEETRVYVPSLGIGEINATPQLIINTPIILDSINWLKFEGQFTASGGENYMVIGNFENIHTGLEENCYVYIDAVKLWYCGPDTTPPVKELVIPNVFTPNQDGINDKFEFVNTEDWEFSTQIYNRWGIMVFEDKNNRFWDGKYQSQLVSEGVYFYVIRATGVRSEEYKEYKGTVTVLYN